VRVRFFQIIVTSFVPVPLARTTMMFVYHSKIKLVTWAHRRVRPEGLE
jgi:hypothetical protein